MSDACVYVHREPDVSAEWKAVRKCDTNAHASSSHEAASLRGSCPFVRLFYRQREMVWPTLLDMHLTVWPHQEKAVTDASHTETLCVKHHFYTELYQTFVKH